jgi:hypothetical protein
LWDALVQLIRWLESVFRKSDFHKRHGRPVDDPGFLADAGRFFSGAGREVPLVGDLVLSGQIEAIRIGAEFLNDIPHLRHQAQQNLLGGLLGRFRD